MNTNDAEIDHLTGWSIWDWILNTVLIFGWVFVTLIVVAAAFAVAAWLMDVSDHVRWSSIVMGAVGVAVVLIGGFASVAGVLLSLNKFYEQTFEVLRHATSWGWSLLTALLVIAVLIGGVVAVYRWLARSMDRWAVLIPSPWRAPRRGIDGHHPGRIGRYRSPCHRLRRFSAVLTPLTERPYAHCSTAIRRVGTSLPDRRTPTGAR